MQDADYAKDGYATILSTDGELLTMIKAGCQPDMITFTPNGRKILVANEGEPREGIGEGVTAPAGSVTIINLEAEDPTEYTAVTVGFKISTTEPKSLPQTGSSSQKEYLLPSILNPNILHPPTLTHMLLFRRQKQSPFLI